MATYSKKDLQRTHSHKEVSLGIERYYGIKVGIITGFNDELSPNIAWDGLPSRTARTIVNIQLHQVGESVVVQFEDGDLSKPLVMGILRASSVRLSDDLKPFGSVNRPLAVTVDDDHLTLTARRSLTLQCGRASITLDSSGHVEIRGTHLVSRSSGQNRIKGTSVSLN